MVLIVYVECLPIFPEKGFPLTENENMFQAPGEFRGKKDF